MSNRTAFVRQILSFASVVFVAFHADDDLRVQGIGICPQRVHAFREFFEPQFIALKLLFQFRRRQLGEQRVGVIKGARRRHG